MSKYRTLGIVNPRQKLLAVFYEGKELEKDPVIALLIVECEEEARRSL